MPRDQTTDLAVSPESPADADDVVRLIDRIFGPGRFAKSAERLREGNRPLRELSFVARQDGTLVGAVRMWPVRIGDRPAVLLGPIAVDPGARRRGLGAELAARACDAAAAAGCACVVLVGDLSFFERLGFQRLEPGRILMPGPVDSNRVLVKALSPGALEGLEGMVGLP